jgi:hypothetical protein
MEATIAVLICGGIVISESFKPIIRIQYFIIKFLKIAGIQIFKSFRFLYQKIIFILQNKTISRNFKASYLILLFIIGFFFYNREIITTKAWTDTIIDESKWKYALGEETETEFLARYFGCKMAVIDYLNNHYSSGVTVDNWSVWHDDRAHAFYIKNTRFANFIGLMDPKIIKDYVIKQNINTIYFKESIKQKFINDSPIKSDPAFQRYLKGRKEFEEYLLKRSTLVFSQGECRLYHINRNQL